MTRPQDFDNEAGGGGGAVGSFSKQQRGSWERRESAKSPGLFYYFNPNTGQNVGSPPLVEPPWYLRESKSHGGQYYYWNEDTNENTVDPPACAKAAPAAESNLATGPGRPLAGVGAGV